MPDVPPTDLAAFAERILAAAGLLPEDAEVGARCMVEANLRGVDTHGVMRLLQYVEAIEAGEINLRPQVAVILREGARALIDADGGYGFRPALLAADTAVELAREHGLGVAGVRASHHFGMAASYALRIAEAGMLAMVCANTGPVMPPFGGARAAMGNNPLAFAIPRRAHAPLVLDMAMSQTAFGRVRLAAVEGRPIPLGWAYDSEGRPTTDAVVALQASLLAPMGGHKGTGLSLVIDVLAAILTGSPVGFGADPHGTAAGGIGHFLLALRPDLFESEDEFHRSLEARLAEVLSTPPTDAAQPVLLPGDVELQMAQRRANGIPISDELAAKLAALAERLGAAPPPWPA